MTECTNKWNELDDDGRVPYKIEAAEQRAAAKAGTSTTDDKPIIPDIKHPFGLGDIKYPLTKEQTEPIRGCVKVTSVKWKCNFGHCVSGKDSDLKAPVPKQC